MSVLGEIDTLLTKFEFRMLCLVKLMTPENTVFKFPVFYLTLKKIGHFPLAIRLFFKTGVSTKSKGLFT